MADTYKITHYDKRGFVKYINILSQNIIKHDGGYRFNLQLDSYDPFARNNQPARAKLADITHAMGVTTVHSTNRKIPASRIVDTTAEEIFFMHIRGIPEWIDMEMKNVEQERLPSVLHQVMVDNVENAAYRSAALDSLKPYLIQKKLETRIDEAQETFIWLKDRFNIIVEVLEALVSVHEMICIWANETSRIAQLCEKPMDRSTFE